VSAQPITAPEFNFSSPRTLIVVTATPLGCATRAQWTPYARGRQCL
jgi:hypothetical protein